MTLAACRRFAGWSALIAVGMALAVSLRAETGHDLWLRYVPLTDPVQRASYRRFTTAIVIPVRINTRRSALRIMFTTHDPFRSGA